MNEDETGRVELPSPHDTTGAITHPIVHDATSLAEARAAGSPTARKALADMEEGPVPVTALVAHEVHAGIAHAGLQLIHHHHPILAAILAESIRAIADTFEANGGAC